MRDDYPLTPEQRDNKAEAFVNSIDQDAICALASRHNHSRPCRIFGTASGSFNACLSNFSARVRRQNGLLGFQSSPSPSMSGPNSKARLPPCGKGDAAAHSFVTTTDVVGLQAYSAQHHNSPPYHSRLRAGRGEALSRNGRSAQSYLILDFVPGHSLDVRALAKDSKPRREHFYSQLIDILAQLRQLEFPAAGSLMPDPRGRPDPVVGNLLSIPMNEFWALCGKTPSSSTFKSATGFAFHQHRIMSEAYSFPTSELSRDTAQLELFALDHLEKLIPELVARQWDAGPFVLTNTDLRGANIIVDDDLNIQALLDWEWACAAPRPLFVPPPWITGHDLDYSIRKEARDEIFGDFCQLLQAKAATSTAHRQLANEWTADFLSGLTPPLAQILQHHSNLIRVYFRFIYRRCFSGPYKTVVSQFFEDVSPKNKMLATEVQRRLDNSERYTQYLKDNGLFVPDEEEQKAREWLQKARELQQKLGLRFDT